MKLQKATPLIVVVMVLAGAQLGLEYVPSLGHDVRMAIMLSGFAGAAMMLAALLWERFGGGYRRFVHGFFHGMAATRHGKCSREGCLVCADPILKRDGAIGLHAMFMARGEPCRIEDCPLCKSFRDQRVALETTFEADFLRDVLGGPTELLRPSQMDADGRDYPSDDEASAVGTCGACRHFSFRDAAYYFDSFPAMVAMREESGRFWTGRTMEQSPRFEDLGLCRLKAEIHPLTETCERYAVGAPTPAPSRPSPPRFLRVVSHEDMRVLEPLEGNELELQEPGREPIEPEVTREAPALDSVRPESEAP